MPINLKALLVVLVLATVVFRFAKPTALLFSTESDFRRRRNLWYVLTTAAFLSPNIWIFALVAAPFLLFIGRKDSNPSALYLFLLHAVPPVAVAIPLPGDAKLIDMSNPVLLVLCVLLPATRALSRSDRSSRIHGLHLPDWCLLAYGLLSSILYLHLMTPDGKFYQSSFSDFVRRVIEFSIGVFIPYYFISRSATNRRVILDNLAAFFLPCFVMAVIGLFESARGWLLYQSIPQIWGIVQSFTSYFVRGSSLRAMASTPHSLSLGFDLAISFGIWLSLQQYVASRLVRNAVNVLLCLGLIVTYSRGPWACAILIYLTYVGLKPGSRSGLFKSAVAFMAVLGAISLSPFGQKIAAMIPFLGGKVGDASIDYRKRLFDRGLEIFRDHPLLGDQYALARMQDLRQGQGIIDLVNAYVSQGLAMGAVGLSLFFLIVLPALFKVLKASKSVSAMDPRFGAVGVSLASGIIGTLFLWAFGGPDSEVLWALVAMALAYRYMTQPERIELLREESVEDRRLLTDTETLPLEQISIDVPLNEP